MRPFVFLLLVAATMVTFARCGSGADPGRDESGESSAGKWNEEIGRMDTSMRRL